MRKACLVLIIALGLCMCSINFVVPECIARDFGKMGATFEIKEEGFISMIKRKLKTIDLAEHEEKMRAIVRKKVDEPTPVTGITRATKTVSYSFDPSYVLDHDVYLPNGKLLYAMGTTVNPLDHMSFDEKLIFIDSRDKSQVEWVRKHYIMAPDTKSSAINKIENNDKIITSDIAVKIILIAGKPREFGQEIGRNIYFDQFGELTKKFNIAHIPAVVEQNGKYLKITEVNIGKH